MKKIATLVFGLVGILVFPQGFTLDENFGNDPALNYFARHNGATIEYLWKVLQHPNGQLYYTGWTDQRPSSLTLTSTTTTGEINPNFDGTFTKEYSIPGSEFSAGEHIVHQGDRIVLGARIIPSGANYSSLALVGLTNTGFFDTSFGDNSYYVFAPADTDIFFGDLAVNDKDEIFIGGRMQVSGGDYEFFVQKLDANGKLDESFGNMGIVRYGRSSSSQWVSKIVFLENDRILVCGTGKSDQFRVLNADGSVHLKFDNENNSSTAPIVLIMDAIVTEDGDYLMAATDRRTLNPLLLKFNSSGKLVTDFGDEGTATYEYRGFMEDVIVTPEEEVYFAGNYQGSHYIIKTDASADVKPFAEGNLKTYSNSLANNTAAVFGIALLSDGSLVAAGQGSDLINSGSGQDLFAFKLNESSLSTRSSIKTESKYYPNPVRDQLFFTNKMIKTIEIYNLLGVRIDQKILHNGSIDLQYLSKGLYLLKSFDPQGRFVSAYKIIKE